MGGRETLQGVGGVRGKTLGLWAALRVSAKKRKKKLRVKRTDFKTAGGREQGLESLLNRGNAERRSEAGSRSSLDELVLKRKRNDGKIVHDRRGSHGGISKAWKKGGLRRGERGMEMRRTGRDGGGGRVLNNFLWGVKKKKGTLDPKEAKTGGT